ncbi:MAG: hypothetical protein IJB97_04955 [Clostridia bacterium]|nr:hypothetical protein [Clostridia bacterium]
MGFDKERQALDELKAKSLETRGELCERLKKLETQYAKKKRLFQSENETAVLAGELLKTFGDQWEADVFISAYGKEYFELRIKREKGANSFLNRTLDALKKLEGKSEKEIAQKLKDFKEEAEKIKNGEIVEMESMIKENLINLFDRTMEDLENYKTMLDRIQTSDEGYLAEEGEQRRKKETLALAKKALDEVKNFKQQLESVSQEDTAEAKKAALEVKEKLEAFRALILSGNQFELADGLKALQKALDAFKEVKGKKKLKEKETDIGAFPEAAMETLKEGGELDELAAAAIVLRAVGYGQKFFDEQEKLELEKMRREESELSLENDKIYQEDKRQLDNLKAQIKTMKDGPFKDDKINRALAIKERMKKRETTIAKDKKKKLERNARVRNAMQKFVIDLKEVAEIYGFSSERTYLDRAKIMAETGVSDFRQLYEAYVRALYNNDEKTWVRLQGKLADLRERFNNPDEVVDIVEFVEENDEDFETEDEKETDTGMTDQERDEAMKMLYDDEEDEEETPETDPEKPETDGDVETVNTDDYAKEKAKENAQRARAVTESID